MARKPRIHVPGGVYHVILRGNSRQEVFFSLLEEGTSRFSCRIHSFCLMPNHIHLAVQVSDVSLSKMMHNISFRYTRWVNYRQERTGHLFQGRYKSILVDRDAYLLELTRYIHLNPVRAGLLEDPSDHPWSSYRAYLGLTKNSWLATDWVLSRFGAQIGSARAHYQNFVSAGLNEKQRKDFCGGAGDSRLLGGDDFVSRTCQGVGDRKPGVSLDAVVRSVCSHYGTDERALEGESRKRRFSEIRGIIGWMAVRTGAAAMAEVARRFRKDPSTMSRSISKVESKAGKSRVFSRELDNCLHKITQTTHA